MYAGCCNSDDMKEFCVNERMKCDIGLFFVSWDLMNADWHKMKI